MFKLIGELHMSITILRSAILTIVLCFEGISTTWGVDARPPEIPPSADEVSLLELSANHYDTASQEKLGGLYEYGFGVKQDYALAAHWYQKAAELGKRHAQDRLAVLYEMGLGVSKDHAKAVNWYRQASFGTENEDWSLRPKSASSLMVFYRKKLDLKNETDWLHICAEAGDSICQRDFATRLMEGSEYLPQDFEKAMEWLLRTSQHTGRGRDFLNPTVEYMIGNLYAAGKGVPQDYMKAMEWYLKAEDYISRYAIGNLYASGRGVIQDYQQAKNWYQRAARGSSEACMALGALYENGNGVSQSDRDAAMWYSKASSIRDLDDLREENGRLVPLDISKAGAVANLEIRGSSGSLSLEVFLRIMFPDDDSRDGSGHLFAGQYNQFIQDLTGLPYPMWNPTDAPKQRKGIRLRIVWTNKNTKAVLREQVVSTEVQFGAPISGANFRVDSVALPAGDYIVTVMTLDDAPRFDGTFRAGLYGENVMPSHIAG